ncbi:hypothetical protein AAVH_29616 [Aphelenchoides avenae]|nr:hypothetical protein AAVH_29616 [Aphelenchus avenae]
MQARILVLLALLPILYGIASAGRDDSRTRLHVKFNTSFCCGKYQPTTGTLKLQFGDSAPFNEWNMTRAFENRITVDDKFPVTEDILKSLATRAAGFRLVLLTPCGALSPIGKMCSHEITIERTYRMPDTDKPDAPFRPKFEEKYELLDMIRGEIDPKDSVKKICV